MSTARVGPTARKTACGRYCGEAFRVDRLAAFSAATVHTASDPQQRSFDFPNFVNVPRKNGVASNTSDGRVPEIALPQAKLEGTSSFEANLRSRRSIREYRRTRLTLEAVGQLLWAAQGVTSSSGERTAPSAGALYPLEVYLLAGRVEHAPAGVYRYKPQVHALRTHVEGDRRRQIAEAALGQSALRDAAAVLIIAAVCGRTAAKYGSRASRYVHIEVGHVAQNIYLQARSLDLGTVIVGAFEDEKVHEVLQLPEKEEPLALLPVGVPQSSA